MYKFKSIQLTNYHLWQDLLFEFQPGITHVYGRNRSGKSLFVSPIPSILYDTDPVVENGSATLAIDERNHYYDFTAYNQSGKRNKFEVSIDGKSQKTETINAARNLIDTHFGNNIQYSLFETTISISGLTEHPLAKKGNKPAQRLDWVHETLAYASLLDSYLEDVERKIKANRDDSVRYNLLVDQLNKLEKVEKPTKDVDAIKAEIVELTKEIKSLETKQRLLTAAINADYNKVRKPERELEEVTKLLTGVEAKITYLEKLKPLYDSYDEDLRNYNKVKTRKEQAKQHYLDLCKKYDRKPINPKKAMRILDEMIDQTQDTIKKAYSTNSLYESQTERRELAESDIRCAWGSKEQYTGKIADLNEIITINLSKIKAANSGKRHCPMCGSKTPHVHDLKAIEEETAKASARLDKLETEYQVFLSRKQKYVEYVDIAELEKALKQLKLLYEVARDYVRHAVKIDKPEQVDYSPEAYKKACKSRDELRDEVIEIKAYAKARNSKAEEDNPYINNFKADNSAKLDKVEKLLKKKYRQQSELTDEIVGIETAHALYRKYRTDRTKIIEAAKPLKQANSDNRLLGIAKKALGRDGFRTKRLESTLELFVHNLNEFAPLIWDEPFKFDIETGPRKCDVVVHRNKKYGTTATLSGSEKRCWQLLSALAMLRLLPDNRRCDTIILDELEANMDIPSRHKMMQDFLPELQKTVPNILIISPLTKKELGIHPDHGYVVQKQGAKSSLLTM